MKKYMINLASARPEIIDNNTNAIVRVCHDVRSAINYCNKNGMDYELFY